MLAGIQKRSISLAYSCLADIGRHWKTDRHEYFVYLEARS